MEDNPYQTPGPPETNELPTAGWPKVDILSLAFQVALIAILVVILLEWLSL
jgi:hypothetical protein